MFFIICSMSLTDLPGGESMALLMALGTIIIAIFSGIFLFYTNSFLIKRRKRELALYNILGMEKRHIAIILFDETLLTALVSIGGGLLFGVVLDKLMYLVLLNVTHFDVTQSFALYPEAVFSTLAVFGVIFLLILLVNLHQIAKAKPIELLHSQAAGEREPKVKWPLVVIGVVCLGVGYYLAVFTKDVLAAIFTFFVAVILVIIGTYCLFTAGSIAVLKTMKRRKGYYYQPQHFASVSGMIYRMKQNAVGLGNICILSTMVLVTVSTTVSLYIGIQDSIKAQFPSAIVYSIYGLPEEDHGKLEEVFRTKSEELGVMVENIRAFESVQFAVGLVGDELITDTGAADDAAITYLIVVSPENYERATGQTVSLQPGEVAVCEEGIHLPDQFSMFGNEYTIVERLNESPPNSRSASIGVTPNCLVVDSDETFRQIAVAQEEAYGDRSSNVMFSVFLDMEGQDEQQIQLFDEVNTAFRAYLREQDRGAYGIRNNCQAASEQEIYTFYGSFLFLGIFMGLLFSMAAVLIIYYKQLIEGYEDRSRFEIMQNVGMDDRLIRSSIRSQILTMFFLPLVMAMIHVCFAFPLLTRLIKLLYLENVKLFLLCTAGTVLVFAAIYGAVYLITSRTYYKIISGVSERRG